MDQSWSEFKKYRGLLIKLLISELQTEKQEGELQIYQIKVERAMNFIIKQCTDKAGNYLMLLLCDHLAELQGREQIHKKFVLCWVFSFTESKWE